MKLQLQALMLLVLFVLSGPALALGIGKLELESALNERFEARIPILSATADELSTLRVGLAGAEMFSRAGLDRTLELRKLNFKLVETETGFDYIHITSQEPIREPFLSFLVELSWANGRLYREYTVLLDPPMYDPEVGRIAAPAPRPTAPPPAEPGPYRHDVLYPGDIPRTPRMLAAAPYTDGDYGPVRRGDTLWSIASMMRPANVTTNQMMLALLRANPDAFIDNNVNALRAGVILRMPATDQIRRLSEAEALAEVRRHYSLWEAGRLALAETPVERPETVTPAPQVDPEIEPAEPGLVEIEDSELRLLAATDDGEALPGDDDGVAIGQLRDDLAVTAEDLEAARQENIELRERLIEAEELIDDLNRLIALKDDELASLQQRMAEEAMEPAAEEPVAVVEDDDEPDVAVAMVEPPVATPAEVAPPDAPEPGVAGPGVLGMVTGYLTGASDFVMGNLTMVGGALAALLALIIGGVFVARRRGAEIEAEADRLVAAGEFPDFSADAEADSDGSGAEAAALTGGDAGAGAEALTEFPVTGETEEEDETSMFAVPEETGAETAAQPEAASEEPEEDPLAEVNVLMAYEHFDQAEEFVRKAITGQPDNVEYHTKLLEVFYASNNKKKYEETARVLRDLTGGEGEHWDMAVAMWQEMSPSRALFEAGVEEEQAAATGGGGIVDITADTAESAEPGADTGAGLDFDLGETAESAAAATADDDMLDLTADNEQQQDDGVLDLTAGDEHEHDDGMLDLTAAAGLEESSEGALDFDMTSESEAPAEEEAEEAGDDLLDVTRDSHLEMDSEEDLLDVTSSLRPGADADTDTSDDGLDFALDEATTGAEEEEKEQEPATAAMDDDNALEFDGGLDFDTGAESEQQPPEAEAGTDDDFALEFDSEPAGTGESDGETALDDIGAELDELEHTLGTLSGRTQSGMGDTSDALKGIDEALGDQDDSALQALEAGSEAGESVTDPGVDLEIDLDTDTGTPVSGESGDVPEQDIDMAAGEAAEEPGVEQPEDRDTGDGGGIELELGDTGDDDGIELELGDTGDDDGIELELGDTGDDEGGIELDLDVEAAADAGSSSPSEDLTLEVDAEPDDVSKPDAVASTTAGESGEAGFSLELDSGEAEAEAGADEPGIDMDATIEVPKSKMPADGLSLEGMDEDDGDDRTVYVPRSAKAEEQSLEDELTTKLDLAKAYVELGDTESARAILEEVMRDGNEAQKRQAGDLLQQI